MIFQSEIGTAKDNLLSPIHNWYKFTAGFSYKLVNELVASEKITKDNTIFDPFAGCGTTLVSAQKLGIKAFGNEAQTLMYEVISTKLEWNIEKVILDECVRGLKEKLMIFKLSQHVMPNIHPLLSGLYLKEDLNDLYFIRDYVLESIGDKKYSSFLKLALAQSLHKLSVVPIAAPYINRGKIKQRIAGSVLDVFSQIVANMFNDLSGMLCEKTSQIYLQDSRKKNDFIDDNSCDFSITSPPYLNNLDYGEVSKVHTHFFDITSDWNDITTKVRKNLVTGSTTHYKKNEFNLEEWQSLMPYDTHPELIHKLTSLHNSIQAAGLSKLSAGRTGQKSFHVLSCLYFYDMFLVLKEMRRVLRPGAKAFLVLGDSAPYGNFVPTTQLIGELSQSAGFTQFQIHKLRDRGSKWKSLKYRHSIDVSENILKIW